MTRRAISLATAAMAALTVFAALLPAAASAAPAPAWTIQASSYPTNFAPGASGNTVVGPAYFLLVKNVGATATSGGSFTIADILPTGLSPAAAGASVLTESNSGVSSVSCSSTAQTVTCNASGSLGPDRFVRVLIPVEVSGLLEEGDVVVDEATVEGGGIAAASTTAPTTISSSPASFGFLAGPPGLGGLLNNTDGSPSTQAGSHPYELSIGMNFPKVITAGGTQIGPIESLRDVSVDLPRGMVANPNATPVLCAEAQLESKSCPDASQVGTITVTIFVNPSVSPLTEPLYNMVPPPGSPASLGFDAAGVGAYVHILGGVRSDGDYGLSADARDILAKVLILGVHTTLWGSPTDAGHDSTRGDCLSQGGSCPVERLDTAFLTMPSACSGPIATRAFADSWPHPGAFKQASFESQDANGNPLGVDGCSLLEFEPTISSQPTTNLADSPSGLDFDLHQPQNEQFGQLSPAIMKDATVTLPAGMSVNPSSADGLGACESSQIGLTTKVGESPIHLSKAPDNCPDSAKLGSVEVSTPLLDHPLPGAVYLAKPFDNPFGSLLAIYLSIDDPQSGVIAKLAGKVQADPVTGRLTTTFTENPQLPIEDVELHLFSGSRGALRTPPTCATHTTTSDLTPWSSPEGLNAHPSDSFVTSVFPGGGSCPTSAAQAPNKPAFSAGTLAPQAGAYSPFVLKLSREDGSQALTGLDTTLPPGLTGKLAGIATCSGAEIAAAVARSQPNQGALEKQSPSCPASSEVGVVNVGAGAGPTPLYVQGHAYLAPPYKGAPLSLAIVTPAVAGPYDLGTVVVRAALYIDPKSAQIHAVSDPFPTILDGIPLDVRSIALKMARPNFTLNPTSCNPMAIAGSATSALGQSVALSSPFQVGGCKGLDFAPKLSLRLRGGTNRAAHPKLIATLKATEGEANIAKAQVKLPPSAFLDQAHIRTVCTRIQFAADACPAGSIYGRASAKTPLLDYPLAGNVYLRSSNNKLPDLIADLRGPDYQPIRIELAGRTDSVKGALRNTFEAVPDAPVSKFRLELFGGKRGLVINSRNLCKHAYRAAVKLEAQSGKAYDTKPLVGSDCAKKHRKGHSHRAR